MELDLSHQLIVLHLKQLQHIRNPLLLVVSHRITHQSYIIQIALIIVIQLRVILVIIIVITIRHYNHLISSLQLFTMQMIKYLRIHNLKQIQILARLQRPKRKLLQLLNKQLLIIDYHRNKVYLEWLLQINVSSQTTVVSIIDHQRNKKYNSIHSRQLIR